MPHNLCRALCRHDSGFAKCGRGLHCAMLKTRLVNAVFYVAIIAGLAVLFLVIVPILWRYTSVPPRIAATPTILQQVQTMSQLITVKYVMEKVIDLPDVKWYGESRVLMIGHGIVMAGIDL